MRFCSYIYILKNKISEEIIIEFEMNYENYVFRRNFSRREAHFEFTFQCILCIIE